MASGLVFLPAALLLAGAVPAFLAGRFAAQVAAWASVLAAAGLWAASHGSLELAAGTLGAGTPATFRLDSVALVCSLAILVPGATALMVNPAHGPARLAALAAAQLAVSSSDLVLASLAAGTAVAFACLQEDGRVHLSLWGGVLAATWAGAALQWSGGTASYGAAPATALSPPITLLVLAAAVLLTGALPVVARRSPTVLAVSAPVGLCLLFRLYLAGDGRLPGAGVNAALAGWAALVLLVTAWRAQAAPDPGPVLDSAVPELSAYGLVAAAAGNAVGGVALALVVLGVGLLITLSVVADPSRRADLLLGAAILAGLPATLGFGARLLALQSLVEGQAPITLWTLPLGLAWLLWLVACTRLPGLAGARARAGGWPARAVAAISVLAGAALAPLVSMVALPAARDVSLASIGPQPSIGPISLNPVSGGWTAAAAAVVLVLLVGSAAMLRGGLQLRKLGPVLPPPPAWRPGLTLPALPAAAVERALGGTRPLVWGILIAALAVIVTRSQP